LTRVQATAAEVRRALDDANSDRLVRVLGPAPAPLARLRGEHRVQILLKSRHRPALRSVVEMALADAARVRGCDVGSVNVEIDPVSLM
jgi:primosomal protein N' (replication factor Y)